jgi:hypothetical protein
MRPQHDLQPERIGRGIGLLTGVIIIMAGSAVASAAAPQGFIDASAATYGGGYNATDATAALQAAINTGQNVWVPNMGTPWNITPISLTKSNQTIQFESGTVVAAKQGAFRGTNDSLFTAGDVSNVNMIGYGATLQMRKDDYTQYPYQASEFRMGISLYHVSDFQIKGLTIKDTGGDAVHVDGWGGPNGGYSQDVLIKDVRFDNNYRQGISVTSVNGLTIDNATILNTSGTWPKCGIDFEPYEPDMVLQNITVKNSIINANGGSGIQFWVNGGTGNLADVNSDVSATIENVTLYGNTFSGITMNKALPNVTIKDSLFVDNKTYGVTGVDSSWDLLTSGTPTNSIANSAFWSNDEGTTTGWVSRSSSLTNVNPLFYSTDPNSPYYMYLSPSVSAQIANGASDGGTMGARPVYGVPEPSAVALLGLCGLLMIRRAGRG